MRKKQKIIDGKYYNKGSNGLAREQRRIKLRKNKEHRYKQYEENIL